MEVPLGRTTTLEVGLVGRDGLVATVAIPAVDVDALLWLATEIKTPLPELCDDTSTRFAA